jgi:hypothetical protein
MFFALLLQFSSPSGDCYDFCVSKQEAFWLYASGFQLFWNFSSCRLSPSRCRFVQLTSHLCRLVAVVIVVVVAAAVVFEEFNWEPEIIPPPPPTFFERLFRFLQKRIEEELS